MEDLNVEREWNQKRSALESSELISAKLINKIDKNLEEEKQNLNIEPKQ